MTVSARDLAALPADARHAVLSGFSAEELSVLEHTWEFWCRDDQRAPPPPWRTWLLLGGRGSGKTRSASEWVREQMQSGRRRQVGVLAPTADSLRRICVEGPSGLLSVGAPQDRPQFEPSTRRVVYPRGGIVHLFSAEEPDRLRGPNLDGLWIDELTSMANAAECWDMAMMALRISGPRGDAPVCIVTTTPKPSPLLKMILNSPTTVTTRSKTSDNAPNLDASTLKYLRDKYHGTRLGRQEMDAELLEDVEGALWSRSLIDACRIKRSEQPVMQRIVVAVDPPGASSKTSAECGIIIAGVGKDRHGYILADISGRMSPEQWARRAVEAFRLHRADRIIAEQNYGGAMVESTIRNVDPNVPVRMVIATRGKQIRAEPVGALYEQHRVHHVGEFPALEDQMCEWDPTASGPSPDRLDALVWAMSELMGDAPMQINPAALQTLRMYGAARRMARGY